MSRHCLRALLILSIAGYTLLAGAPAELSAQIAPALRLVSLQHGHLHAGVLGRGWMPGSMVAVVIHPAPAMNHASSVPFVLSPSTSGLIEVGFGAVPCGGVRVVARDSLGHRASLSFSAACAHPGSAFRYLRLIKGRFLTAGQRRYLDHPDAPTSISLHLGDRLFLWEPGTAPPLFTPSGGVPNIMLLSRVPYGPWIGCPVQGCPAATTSAYVALIPGEAVIHMIPGCTEGPGCASSPFDIKVHVAAE